MFVSTTVNLDFKTCCAFEWFLNDAKVSDDVILIQDIYQKESQLNHLYQQSTKNNLIQMIIECNDLGTGWTSIGFPFWNNVLAI